MHVYYAVEGTEGGWNGGVSTWVVERYVSKKAAEEHCARLNAKEYVKHVVEYHVREVRVKMQ